VHVQVFGDSVAHNCAPYDQAALDQRYGAGAVVIDDRAVGGSYSQKLVDGTDGLNRPWPQDVTAPITTMDHGLNDVVFSDEVYRANLLKLVPTVYVTPTTMRSTAGEAARAHHMAAIMREVAAQLGRPVADVDAFTSTYAGWDGLLFDDVHPGAEGCRLIADKVLVPALAPFIAALRAEQ
jgi:hypothetical protein